MKKEVAVIPSKTPYPIVTLLSEADAGIPSEGSNIITSMPKELIITRPIKPVNNTNQRQMDFV